MEKSVINYNTDEIEYRCFDALVQMMETRDLDKCPTAELLERADVSRSTFYRHYQDKYDLLNKSYDKLLDHTFFTVNEGYSYKKTFLELYTVLQDYHGFFAHAFNTGGQNSLRASILERMKIGMKGMLSAHGVSMEKQYNRYLLSGYLNGTLEITYEWIMNGAQESPDTMLRLVYALMPEEIRAVVALYYM